MRDGSGVSASRLACRKVARHPELNSLSVGALRSHATDDTDTGQPLLNPLTDAAYDLIRTAFFSARAPSAAF
ncbi:hypothetical protein TrVGV298_011726 [Trichoderma virens]|nr:hypothetical protein TrVGV298_011726 [Trichoderma virens]